MSLFQQIKQRRFLQFGLSYAGIAWAIMSGVDQLVNRGFMPEMLYRVVLIWVVVGIPGALLVAWHHGARGDQKAPRSEVVGLGMLALVAMALSGMTVQRERLLEKASGIDALDRRKIAVLYFRDETPDSSYQYLADGLTEALITELGRVQALNVISRNGTAPFRGVELTPDSVARVLKAGTVIEGSITRRNGDLRVEISAYAGESGTKLPGGQVAFNHPMSELLTLRAIIAEKTAPLIRQWIGDEIRLSETASGTSSLNAWSLLQRAEKARKDAEALVRSGDAEGAFAAFTQADSLLALAQERDPAWADPPVARAAIAYRESRLAQSNPPQAVSFVETGQKHVAEALQREETNARALELRGTMNYYLWLLQVIADPRARQDQFDGARRDLETAVQYDKGLASAYATLSHLYYQDDVPNAVVAAQSAYAADAYLESADVVLWRLYNGHMYLGNFVPARRACETGAQRFPTDYRFVHCELRLMTTQAESANATRAWRLLAQQDSLTPPIRLPFEHTRGEMMIAGVLGRANQKDSARAVLRRARDKVTDAMDPAGELVTMEAYAWTLIGDKDDAIAVLEKLKARDPSQFDPSKGEVEWYWRSLQDHPKYKQLFSR